ncbi:MAG: hypothetical protein M0Q44_01435 [Methylobacter sp.]|jgi:hypothetical protein|nr:hypothetical protein [Methylobacter sp.]
MSGKSPSYLGPLTTDPGATGALVPQRQEIDRDFAAKSGLTVTEGANAKQGVATLVAGTVVVANTSITANSRIFLTAQTNAGTTGFLSISARTPGTNFTILSSSNLDTSVVAYEIFEPAVA